MSPHERTYERTDDGPLAELRRAPENPHGFGGYGPLVALAVLVLLVVLLAPTVAPERIVLQPSDAGSTTSTSVVAEVPGP